MPKATDKARNVRPSHEKRLAMLSGNECASPNCPHKKLIAYDNKTITAKICHIEAASENGPRYRESMTDDERRHYDNLLFLCSDCHSIIDNKENEGEYPVALLKDWKKEHEAKYLEILIAKTSLLSEAINFFASVDFDDSSNTSNPNSFPSDPEEKILFNNLQRNKSIISEYKVLYGKINTLYEELEKQGSFKKHKLLRYLRGLYLKTRDKYMVSGYDIELLRTNADNIFEDIQDELLSQANTTNQYNEDIMFGISIIMVDAFIRCKILENPNDSKS